MISIKENWSLLLFLFLLGIVIGGLAGFYRASVYYNGILQTKEYSFNKIISSPDGNTIPLKELNKSFSCIIFDDNATTMKFYQDILMPALQEKPVCFKGG